MKRDACTIARAFAVILLAGLGACGSAPPDAGFSIVEQNVSEGGGYHVGWAALEPERADADVKELLARPLAADDAVRVALRSNPSLQTTFESLGIARGDLIEAGTWANPTLDARVRWSDHTSTTNPELALMFDVTDLIRRGKRKAVADANLERAVLEASDAVLRLASDVRVAYFALLGAEQVRKMRREVLSAAEAAAELAERQRDVGNINALTLSTEQGARQEARLELTRSEGDAAIARIELARVMGVPASDTVWTVVGELPGIPEADPSGQELEAIALQGRFDLRAAHKAVESARREVSYRKWFFIPSFEVGVDAERDFDHEWALGPALQMSVPIFDRGQGGVERAKAMLRQAEHDVAAMKNDVRHDVRAAQRRLQAARDAVEIYRDGVIPTREQIVAESQKHYNFMLIGAVTLLQAKRDEIDAYREYIEAVREYWMARTDLERVVAARLGPEEQP
jgi:cobalt-zinc-cadmium efflux system outer membrane protein